MDLVIPLTGQCLRVPIPADLPPENRRWLALIAINAIAVKRAAGGMRSDANYARSVVAARLKAKGALWQPDARDRENLARSWRTHLPDRYLEKLSALLGAASQPAADPDLVGMVEVLFAHGHPSSDCRLCVAASQADLGVYLRLAKLSPRMIGDIWDAAVGAGLVCDVTSPGFAAQLLVPTRRAVDVDDDPF
jgi:hypothetical protein